MYSAYSTRVVNESPPPKKKRYQPTVRFPEPDWSDYEKLVKLITLNRKREVQDLLAKGCRVVRPDTLNSPLHLAVEKIGWSHIVKQLLDRGAQVGFRNAENNTALHHAFLYEVPDACINHMMQSVLVGSGENLANDEGLNFLHIACARSKLTYVREFLSKAVVDVNAQVEKYSGLPYAGYTALHFAVESGKSDIAACLLEFNADIYASAAGGSTPLHLACRRRNIGMIDMLLAYDRHHINYIDKFSMSHFMAACMSSDPLYAQQYLIVAHCKFKVSPLQLVAETTDPLVDPFPGYTPLHFAAEFGRSETVKMLLVYGASCCALTANIETPLMLARKNSHTEVCEVLKQNCDGCQARMDKSAQVAQSQGTPGSETPIDKSIHHLWSSLDTGCGSAPPYCEQRATPVFDLSESDCMKDSNCEIEALDLSCVSRVL